MEILFLGQDPFSDESAKKIINSLENEEFNQFTAIVAFASERGVRSIIDQIKNAKKHRTKIQFYIGIDQQVTSYEALKLLLESKIDCYIYHPNSDHFIFHPKIYIFEGGEQGRIIIGSSNLTKRGLSLNMEASLVVNFGMNDKEGVVLLNQIKKNYPFLLDRTLPNIKKLTPKLLDLFVALKKVTKGKQREAKSKKSKTPQIEKLLAEFNAMFPPVKIPKNTPKSRKRKTPTSPQQTAISKEEKTLVWEKEKLSPSDAQQVSREATNPTRVLRFTQEKFEVDDILIDHEIYFRNKVFDKLKWTPKPTKKKPDMEEAYADFEIEIEGEFKGSFPLRISNDPSKKTGITRIYWGKAMSVIIEQDNSGKTLSLFRIENEPNLFLIKIEKQVT